MAPAIVVIHRFLPAYRLEASSRRHQTSIAADAFAVVEYLNLQNAVHIVYYTGGGEVARYVAKHGQLAGRVTKAVLVSAVPWLKLKTEGHLEACQSKSSMVFGQHLPPTAYGFSTTFPASPFYGFNREGAKAHYDGIKAFLKTDQTEDLEAITVLTPILYGEDDHIAPIGGIGAQVDQTFEEQHPGTYPGLSRGMLKVNADVLNAELLAFIQARWPVLNGSVP